MSFLKIFLPVLFWIIFILVVLFIPYPQSLPQADFGKLSFFFIPLYFALSFTINIFLKKILISSSISLGLIFLLTLKALDSLNLVTVALTLVSVYLLISSFRKNKMGSLTNLSKIPKLTNLRRRRRV